MKNAIIFIIALAVSNLALAESPAQIYGKYAAPFGLEWGLSKEQVTAMGVKLTPLDPTEESYATKTLPKNLSDGKYYLLAFMQGFGLVEIRVLTSSITNDVYGSKGKERYNELKTAIVNKYGKPSKEWEWTDGSRLYDDSDQFYECLRSPPCGLWASAWGNDTDGMILLEIASDKPGVGYISLSYASVVSYTARQQEAEEKSRSDEDAL